MEEMEETLIQWLTCLIDANYFKIALEAMNDDVLVRYLSIYWYIYLFIYLSIHLSIHIYYLTQNNTNNNYNTKNDKPQQYQQQLHNVQSILLHVRKVKQVRNNYGRMNCHVKSLIGEGRNNEEGRGRILSGACTGKYRISKNLGGIAIPQFSIDVMQI